MAVFRATSSAMMHGRSLRTDRSRRSFHSHPAVRAFTALFHDQEVGPWGQILYANAVCRAQGLVTDDQATVRTDEVYRSMLGKTSEGDLVIGRNREYL